MDNLTTFAKDMWEIMTGYDGWFIAIVVWAGLIDALAIIAMMLRTCC